MSSMAPRAIVREPSLRISTTSRATTGGSACSSPGGIVTISDLSRSSTALSVAHPHATEAHDVADVEPATDRATDRHTTSSTCVRDTARETRITLRAMEPIGTAAAEVPVEDQPIEPLFERL